MKNHYKLVHRLLACALLLSLFLQSCGGSLNQFTPQEKELTSRINLELSDNPLVNIDKNFVTSGGYLASFYEKNGELKADLKADEKQPRPNYKGVPVLIDEGTDLTSLTKLDSTTQQSRIELNRSHSGQLRHITIRKGGLSGGMRKGAVKKGDEDQEKEKKKKEASTGAAVQGHETVVLERSNQVNSTEKSYKEGKKKGDEDQSADNDLEYRKDLLERARKGVDKAQFELGEWAYNAWQCHDPEGDIDEALHWLIQAEAQNYLSAVNLLQKIKKNHPELVEKINEKLAERGKNHDFNSSRSSSSEAASSTDPTKGESSAQDAAWRERNFNTSFSPIDAESIQYIEEIGRGGMGQVFKAKYQKKEVAVKSLHKLERKQIDAFKKEARVIANLKHPNIISFLGFFITPKAVCRPGPYPEQDAFMMEYASQGSLWSLLKSHKEDRDWDPSWQLRYQIVLDVAEGLNYLHQWDIVHCDLKSDNILLDSRGRAKITDFGTAALKTENSTYGEWTGGTLRWMAPELFGQDRNSKAGDVYSYGMVLWQLGSRKEPFKDTFPEISMKIAPIFAQYVLSGNKEEIKGYNIPSEIEKIIKLCWLSELERPKMKRVRHLLETSHPDFIDKEKEDLISQLEESSKQKDNLRNQLEELDKYKKELVNRLESLIKEKKELASRLKKLEQIKANIEEEKEEIHRKLQEEYERNQEGRVVLKSKLEELEERKNVCIKLQEEVTIKQATFLKLREENEASLIEKKKLINQVEDLKQDKIIVEHKNEELISQLKKLNKELEKEKEQLIRESKQVGKLVMENERIVMDNECKSNEIENLTNRFKQAQAEKLELECSLEQKRVKEDKLFNTLSKYKELFKTKLDTREKVTCQFTLTGNGGPVWGLAVWKDNRIISAGANNNSIKVWDLNSKKHLFSLTGHTNYTRSLLILPNDRLVSGAGDQTIKIWDLNSQRCLDTLHGHVGSGGGIMLLPDDNHLVSCATNNTIEVWDLNNKNHVYTLSGHKDRISGLAMLPDGKLVSASKDKTIKVWDIASQGCLYTLTGHTDGVSRLAVLSNRFLISASNDKTIKVWDTTSQRCLHTLRDHISPIWNLKLISHERLVSAAAGADGTIKVWDINSWQCLYTFSHTPGVDSFMVLPDGRFVTGANDGTIKVWDESQWQLENDITELAEQIPECQLM